MPAASPDPHAVGIAHAIQQAMPTTPHDDQTIALFGSRAAGKHRPDSDVDIMVISNRFLTPANANCLTDIAQQAAQAYMAVNPPQLEIDVNLIWQEPFLLHRHFQGNLSGQVWHYGIFMRDVGWGWGRREPAGISEQDIDFMMTSACSQFADAQTTNIREPDTDRAAFSSPIAERLMLAEHCHNAFHYAINIGNRGDKEFKYHTAAAAIAIPLDALLSAHGDLFLFPQNLRGAWNHYVLNYHDPTDCNEAQLATAMTALLGCEVLYDSAPDGAGRNWLDEYQSHFRQRTEPEPAGRESELRLQGLVERAFLCLQASLEDFTTWPA